VVLAPYRDSPKKTVLRTIRISEDYDETLRRDSKARGLSVNALLSTIIAKHVEWDRYSERFGFLSLSRETFRSIIEATDEKRLDLAARELGARIPKEAVLFWRRKLTLDSFLAFLAFVSKYQKIAEYEIETESEESVITARHELGEKWSKWLRAFLDEALRTSFGIQAEFDLSKGFVIARFSSK
jgi:hypothetical protein